MPRPGRHHRRPVCLTSLQLWLSLAQMWAGNLTEALGAIQEITVEVPQGPTMCRRRPPAYIPKPR